MISIFRILTHREIFTFTGQYSNDLTGNVIFKTTGKVTAPTFEGALTGNATSATSATTAANLSGTPALPGGTTATTQSAGDNSTKLATTAYPKFLA